MATKDTTVTAPNTGDSTSRRGVRALRSCSCTARWPPGHEEWEAQRPLADEGFRLLVLDRRGYGRSPAAEGEDFLRDADDIAELMGDGAHLVGHSYGGLGALFAAARRPEATLSLTLLEAGGLRARPGPTRRARPRRGGAAPVGRRRPRRRSGSSGS